MSRRFILMVFLALAQVSLAGDEAGARARFDRWLAAQTNVFAWSAEFVQVRQFKSLAQPLATPGRIWFAAPDQFR